MLDGVVNFWDILRQETEICLLCPIYIMFTSLFSQFSYVLSYYEQVKVPKSFFFFVLLHFKTSLLYPVQGIRVGSEIVVKN